jgi:hypothetical protein
MKQGHIAEHAMYMALPVIMRFHNVKTEINPSLSLL